MQFTLAVIFCIFCAIIEDLVLTKNFFLWEPILFGQKPFSAVKSYVNVFTIYYIRKIIMMSSTCHLEP